MFRNSVVRTTRHLGRMARPFSTNPTQFRAVTKSSLPRNFLAVAGGIAVGTLLANEGQMPFAAAGSASVNWKSLAQDIEDMIDADSSVNPSVDDAPGAAGGGGDIGPMLVRLAWHCSGTYCKSAKNGGSDGATMRYAPESNHGGNAGLGHARALLEPIKKKYPGVSYADLYIFAGKVALEQMGAENIEFKYGRTDAPAPAAPRDDKRFSPDGRLPDGGKPTDSNPTKDATIQHIRDIFYRMGFNDQEIVALSGAHTLGRCHTDRSGYWGPWSRAPTTLSNEYFRLLKEEKWTPKKTHKGGRWNGPMQFEDKTGELMMLPTDMALTWDPEFNKWVEIYWKDEAKFQQDFSKAWTKLTELGCSDLKSTEGGWLSWLGF